MNAREIVKTLGGTWHGSSGLALCPAHDDGKTPALSVRDGVGGAIVIHCFAGCDWRDVKDALQERGLLPEWRPGQGDGGDRKTKHIVRLDEIGVTRIQKQQPAAAARRHEVDARKRTETALKLWNKAVPATGTLVETYLRSRGVTIVPPPTIRYLAGAKHGPTRLILPAMVAAVQNVGGEIVGIHRTFLKADGSGKSPVSQNKMMLGPCSGGAVRLAPVTVKLAVAEGIESALSVQQVSEVPTWAALSTSGVKALALPSEVREVLLYPDGDEPGERAAVDAAKRFLREDRDVKIARLPQGKDPNDLVHQEAGHG